MGCEVVSVYADEVVGKVTYPDPTVTDIAVRDYPARRLLPHSPFTAQRIHSLYGFTSSIASRVEFAQVGGREYLVQVAGRFIVVWDGAMGQRVAANAEVVSSWDVQGRMCLVGLPGGTLLLWDLQFLEIKLELLLPVGALNVTTVSLTGKSLFATDTSQSIPSAYCYDIRTGKLKGFTPIATFESALKGITAGDELHAYVCSEGVWFIKMAETGLEAVRGMFGGYPRTAMECLQRTANYLATGGVDGYVYLWSTETYRCIRAFKVGEQPINAMAARNKQLLLGVGDQRIKMYTFDVKPSEKKVKKEYDEEGEVRREETDEFAFVQADSFPQEGTTIAMAISETDPLMYYCLTREGVFCRKWLPAPSADQRRPANRNLSLDLIQKSSTAGKLRLIGGRIYSASKTTGFTHEVTVLKLNGKQLSVEEERVAQSGEAVGDQDCAYCPETQELVYVTTGRKLNVCLTYNKVGDALETAGQSDLGNNNRTIEELGLQTALSVDFTANGWLVVTTGESVFVFQRKGKLQYEEIAHRKYEKEVPKELMVGEKRLAYEQVANRWREEEEKWRSVGAEKVEEWELVHGGKVKSRSSEWEQAGLSCGCGYYIFWK